MTLNHVHFGTLDLSKIVEFYQRYFGFRVTDQHGGGVFMRNQAGFLIAIDPVDELPRFPDWYHLGFCLDQEAAVLQLHREMTSHGLKIARELRRSEGKFASFYVFDPDGNKIEVSWHNE